MFADLAFTTQVQGLSPRKHTCVMRLLSLLPDATAQLYLIPWDDSTMQILQQRHCLCGTPQPQIDHLSFGLHPVLEGVTEANIHLPLCDTERLTSECSSCVLPLHSEVKHTDIPCFTPGHQPELSWNPSTPPFHSTACCRISALAMWAELSLMPVSY